MSSTRLRRGRCWNLGGDFLCFERVLLYAFPMDDTRLTMVTCRDQKICRCSKGLSFPLYCCRQAALIQHPMACCRLWAWISIYSSSRYRDDVPTTSGRSRSRESICCCTGQFQCTSLPIGGSRCGGCCFKFFALQQRVGTRLTTVTEARLLCIRSLLFPLGLGVVSLCLFLRLLCTTS